MIDRMDQEIGRVLAQISEMGATDDTLVFFMSDNGASPSRSSAATAKILPRRSALPRLSSASARLVHRRNTPLRLHKSWVHEGGISTPLIVNWPKGIAARGELRRNPGHVIDLAPTILESGRRPLADGLGTDVSPAAARQEPGAGLHEG